MVSLKPFLINRFFLLFSFIMISRSLCAQTDSSHLTHHTIYLEAGGAGSYGSLNYERMIHSKKKLSFSMRVGTSTYHIRDYRMKFNPDIIVPLSIHVCYGKDHKVEVGAGQTIASIVHVNATDIKPARATNFHTHISIGYRYQKNSGGIVLRCAYTPIIEFNKYFRHWVGVAIGYSF